jgi:signal transduction histidine kinase
MRLPSQKTPLTIRFHLLRLVVASVLPVWLVACVLVCHAYLGKRDQVNRNMLETARSLTKVVDRELASVQSALLALASSPSFAAGDLAGVQRQALQILQSYPDADIIVADGTGQQLVNSSRPYGSPLPKRAVPETVRRIFETGKPAVSGLFTGAVSRQQQISIDIPVKSDGKVVYDLALVIRSDPMATILQQAGLPPDWYGLILDKRQILVARSFNSDRSVGSRMPAALGQAQLHASEGTAEATGLEGQPALVTFCRSALADWTVVIEVPRSTVMAPLYQWIGWAVFGATLISLVGIFLALGFARKIARDIQSLVQPALSLGRGGLVAPTSGYAVKETEEVSQALVQAFDLLQVRAAERDQAERELSKTVADLELQTRERQSALEKLSEKDQLLLQQGRQAAMGEMIGNIAHQWRQPLSALGLILQQASLNFERGRFEKKNMDECVKKSMGLINHMSSSIDDFRNFFRTDQKKVKFRVDTEVKRTLSLLEESFARERISIEVAVTDDPFIYGYPNEFSQVLLNILTNARDEFASRAVADPRVRIALSGDKERALVTIADNAGGIPEEIMGKIFDPYFTTKEPQSGKGAGLFMSRTIIEKNMGGSLSARNADAGAVFSMEF